jgi:glycosyltransferase involved in cell wall biosynthesis
VKPIAYVATGYPLPSHTFIQSEVRALRELGVTVRTFTPKRSDPAATLSEADREAYASTFALRPVRPVTWARAHLAAIAAGAWLRGLRAAWRARGRDWRSPVWQLFYFAQAVVLWWACRREGIRHIHAHFANVGSDVAMLAAAMGGEGWSWSFTMHGPTEFYDVGFFRLDRKVADARFVACISDFARSQLMRVSQLRVVRCGIDHERIPSSGRVRSAGEPVRITSVGRLVPEKGQPLLLDAVRRLLDERHEVELTLIGEGPARETLERRIEQLGLRDHVVLRGATAHPDVLELVAQADIFCLPSFAEGVPVSLMEAMACGRPVVSTRIMGVPELITDGESGLLVSPGSGPELVDALRRLVQDGELAAELGRNGAARVASDFDLRRETARLRDIFRDCVA